MAFKIATCVALVRPSRPISAIYTHGIVRMLGLPKGAADTGPMDSAPPIPVTE